MQLKMGSNLSTIYLITTTTTYQPKETIKPPPFHDKNLQKAPLPLQKYCMVCGHERRIGRPQRRSGAAHAGG